MRSYHSYDASETNAFRMWQAEKNRNFHIKTLNTIYKQKQMLKNKSNKQVQKRQLKAKIHQNCKDVSVERKYQDFQDKVNFENRLLRDKLMSILFQKNKHQAEQKNRSKSLQRYAISNQIYNKNIKLKERLCSVKTNILSKEAIEERSRKTDQFKSMIQKKSPMKKAYLKTLSKKKSFKLFFQ